MQVFWRKLYKDLLLHPEILDPHAQEVLLNEVEQVFTEEDNQMFTTPPTKNDIWKTICESNLNAAPGSDGIPSLFYKECWKIMDDSLLAIMKDILVFGAKPKSLAAFYPKTKEEYLYLTQILRLLLV